MESSNCLLPPLSTSSVNKKDDDLAEALSRASGLEDELHKNEAALSTAVSQNATLTSELADVKRLLDKVNTASFFIVKKQ